MASRRMTENFSTTHCVGADAGVFPPVSWGSLQAGERN